MSEELKPVAPEASLALQRVGQGLFRSGLFPNAKNEYGAFAIIEYGHELGIPPMMALKNINIISGQLACNAQLILALAMARGVKAEVITETDKGCEILFTREGHKPYTAKFDEKDAQAAGLAGKDNWRKWPKDMYYWRAVAKGVRRIAPDAVMGLYTVDEITDGKFIDVQDVPVEPKQATKEAETITQPEPDKAIDVEYGEHIETPKELLIREIEAWCSDTEGSFSEEMANGILSDIDTREKPITWKGLQRWDEKKYASFYVKLYNNWTERQKAKT